jgi:broad specificity phosphatase PhoE
MPEMELILIRHGETEWNRERFFRGHEDIPLNANGIAMADLTADALKDRVFEAIYSSPLKRAVVTAKRIALPHQIDVREKWGLIDIDYGIWAGMKEDEVKAKWSKDYDRWLTNPAGMKFLRGESMKKAWKRVNSALREILFLHGTGSVVIVSHRIPIKMMTAYMLHKKPREIVDIKHDPCGISIFQVSDRKPTPVKLNDTSHLESLGLGNPPDF